MKTLKKVKTVAIATLMIMPLTSMADDLINNKIKVFEALKAKGIIIAATYQSESGKKNDMSTLLTNAGIVNVNYATQSIFINNDIININKKGEFVSSNARVVKEYLNDLEYKIIAKSDNEKYRIQVFTDVSCEHCQKFHRTVADLNRLGITVEFILTSGKGDQAPSFNQMSDIQSEPNQLQALTNQMNGIVPASIPKEPSIQMALHQQAAIIVGVTATPTIYYKGLKLPISMPNKYPELLDNLESSLMEDNKEYGAHRVN